MPNQCKRVEAQRGTEIEEVGHIGCRRIDAILGPLAIATAPLIQGQDVVVFTHSGGKVVPGVGMPSQPVEEHHRRVIRGSPIEIMQLQTIGHNGLVLWLYL